MAYPTIYNPRTGQWEEVNEDEAQAEYGIPIGPPTQYSEDLHEPPSGGLEMPGNEPPDYYNPGARESFASAGGKPQLFASNEPGVPAEYQTPDERDDYDPFAGYPAPKENEDYIPLEGEVAGLPSGFVPHEGQTINPAGLPRGATPAPASEQPVRVAGLPPGFEPAPGQEIAAPKERFPPTYDLKYEVPIYPNVAKQREHLVDEIDGNPLLREYLAVVMSQEGKPGRELIGVLESLFNRTLERNSSITRQTSRKLGFYGPVNTGRVEMLMNRNGGRAEQWMLDQFDDALDAVRNGSDVIDGRTDQGQVDEVKGPKILIGREYFGNMDGDPTWQMQHLRTRGSLGPAYRKRGEIAGLVPRSEQPQEYIPGLPKGFTPIGPEDQGGVAGLPPGFTPSEQQTQVPQQLPSGEIVSTTKPRYKQAAENRDELSKAIKDTEDAGYKVPHTIGKPDEPEGDRAPTIDMENLVEALAKQAQDLTEAGKEKEAAELNKQIAYWEDKIETGGMSAEQEARSLEQTPQTPAETPQVAPRMPATGTQQLPSGEIAPTTLEGQETPPFDEVSQPAEPVFELPRLSPEVARMFGFERWADIDTGKEVRRAQMVEGGLPIRAQNIPYGTEQGGMPPTTRAEARAAEEAGKPLPEMLLPPPTAAEGFNTKLSPEQEKDYQSWKAKYAPKDSGADYDLRGAYRDGFLPDPKSGHWPDKYKKPNHPTFSVESQYAVGKDAEKAGHWEDGKFVPPGDGMFGFQERKKLYPGEDQYFKAHPEVGGMAADDNTVILNPYSPPGVNKKAILRNEAFRLKMQEFGNTVPDFKLTDEQKELQKKVFKGTPYEKDEAAMKQTIAARIYSGDPSAVNPTEEQKKWVDNFAKFERRQVGFMEGMNRYAAKTIGAYEKPVLGSALEYLDTAVQSVAPNSSLSRFISAIKANYADSVSEREKKEAGLPFDPKKEQATLPGELGSVVGTLAIDYPVIAATTAVFPQAAGAKLGAKIMHGAGAMTLPAARAGKEAADAVKERGGSIGEQAKAFIVTMLETQAMGAVPLSQSSAAKNVIARMGERAAKGGVGFALIEEGIRDVHNLLAPVIGEQHIPYDPKRSIVSTITGAGMAVGLGGKEAPAREPFRGRPIDLIERAEITKSVEDYIEATSLIRGQSMAASQTSRTPTETEKHTGRIAEIDAEINKITAGKDKLSDSEAKQVGDLLREAMDLSQKVQEAAAKPPEPAPEKPSEAKEPVEPTHDIKTTKSSFVREKQEGGKRGEIKSEKDGELEVEWDDDTTSKVKEADVNREPIEETVNRNTVMVVPAKKGSGARVIHYDENGNKVSDTNHDLYSEAVTKAENLTKDNNLSGYFDINDNFVRERGTAKEAAPEYVADIENVEEPPKAAPEGTEEPPGMTPAQREAYERAAEPVPDTFFDKWENRIRKVARKLGIQVAETRKIKQDWNDIKRKYDHVNMSLDVAVQTLKDYKVGGKTAEQIVNSHLPFFKNPVRINWSDTYPGGSRATSGAAASINPRTGQVTITLNPRQLLPELEATKTKGVLGKGAKYGTKFANKLFFDSLGEEMIHAAQNQAIWKEWEALSPAQRATRDVIGKFTLKDGFYVYKYERFNQMLDKMQQSRQGLTQAQRDAIDQSIVDGYNAYYADAEAAVGARLGFITSQANPNSGVYDFIRRTQSKTMLGHPRVMSEITRQMLQKYKTGHITEETMAETSAPIRQAYQQTLNRLNEFLGGMFGKGKDSTPEGAALRESIKEELDAWDEILNDKDLRAAQQKHSLIEPYKAGTTELNNFLGKSVVGSTVLYHVHPFDIPGFDPARRTDDLGYHIGTWQAAASRFFALTSGRLKEAMGFVTMPLYAKLENPAYVSDAGWMWSPGALLASLRRGNYISAAEGKALIAKAGGSGKLTNPMIREYLQKKGYDSLAYINHREGKRTIHGQELEDHLSASKLLPQKGGGYAIQNQHGRVIGAGPRPDAAWGNARTNLEAYPHGVDYSYIAFEPTQLKSATGNKGTYDIRSADLNEAKVRRPREEKSIEARIAEAHNAKGGSSISQTFGDVTGKDFFSVEVYPDKTMPVNGKVLTEQDIYDFRNLMMKDGIDLTDPHKLIGTWVNEKGNTEMGVAALIPDMHAALDIAREYGQRAIWDNAVGGEIWVNGPFREQLGGLPSIGERMGFIEAKSRKLPTIYETTWKNIDLAKLAEAEKDMLNDKGIRAAAIKGQAFKDWYTTWDKFMRTDFVKNHPEYHPLFSWFIAATSPHNQVGGNFTAGLKAFRNFVETGDPTVPLPGQPGMMSTYFPNLRRVVGLPSGGVGEQPTHLLLSGGKVPEYAPALLGDPWAIAVDMHVSQVLFGTKEPTDYQRMAGQMAIMRVSKRMGWNPAEVQAAIFATDILGSKKPKVVRLEDYAERHRAEFQNLLAADIHRGAPGAAIGRGILERASQRIGPERLLRTSDRNIDLIRQARFVAVNPELAAGISLSGPKLYGPNGEELVRPDEAKGRMTGRNVGGIPTTEFDNRVASAYRLRRLYDGAKHVFWNSPGLQGLGDSIHRHTDLAKKLIGEHLFPFFEWERKMGMTGKLSGAKKGAINEVYDYYEAKAGGKPTKSLSPAAKDLVARTDTVVNKINAYNAKMGIKIQDPNGKWVPIPKIEFPSQIKQSVMEAMRHPNQNQREWRDLVDGWKADKILPMNATEADAVNMRDKVLAAYNKNGAFSRLFFHPNLLPKRAFDYSYKSMHEFINAWSERAAQVEAFGATREKDVFREAINHTADEASRNYISTVQGLAYGDIANDLYGRFMTSSGQWASIVHLANWYSATKNLVSGQGFNMAALGPWGFGKAFFQVIPFRAVPEAVEKGIVVRDLMNIMTYGEQLGNMRQQVGRVAFKASLWNAAEVWNRGVAFVGTRSILRKAIDSYKANPRSDKTLRYMAHMQRLGFRGGRADLLMQENGKGELTDEYLRQAVNQIHGGYTYADVPVYMSTHLGKALFKYQKWGAEQSRFFMREILRPAGRGMRLAAPDRLDVLDAQGNKQTVVVPRSVSEMLPLASYIFSVGAAGALQAWLLERMFGVRQKIVSLAEALAQYKKGGPEKFNKFAEMVWGYHRLAGSMGALGGYAQSGLVFAGIGNETQGNKLFTMSAESLPNLDPFIKLGESIRTLHDQGWRGGWRDVDKLADAVGFYRTGKQLVLHQADVIGFENRYSDILANRQDLSVAKAIQRRYAHDIKYELKKGPTTPAQKSEISIWRDPLDDALAVGDLESARAIIARAKAGMSEAQWRFQKEKLKDHIREKQPIDPLERGAAARPDFWKWTKENISTYDQALMHRLQDTYRTTAKQLMLGIQFKPASKKDVHRLRKEMMLRQEPMTY